MGLEIKVWFSLIFKNVFITFAFKGSNPVRFSEKTKLKVGYHFQKIRFRKTAIRSEQWTCMLICIRLLDKVNEGVFSYISTLELWKNPHFHIKNVDPPHFKIENVDVMWRNVDVMWRNVYVMWRNVYVLWNNVYIIWKNVDVIRMLCGEMCI